MGFCNALQSFARRWYVVGPIFVLTLAAAAAAYTAGPTRYFSSAVLLLTEPPTGSKTYGKAMPRDHSNPLFLSDGNVMLTSAMLAQEMSTREFAERIGAPGIGSTQISVNNGAANPELLVTGPFLFINVDSDSPDESKELVTRAVADAKTTLERWQVEAGAPSATFMILNEIMPPSEPYAGHGSAIRAALAALALGLLASLKAGAVAERWARSERHEG